MNKTPRNKSTQTPEPKGENIYRTLVESMPDAIVVHRDGRFLYANCAALQLLGAESLEQLASYTVLNFFRPEERERAAERMRTVMNGDRLPVREARLLRLDDHEITVEFHTTSINFQGNRAIQTMVRDVTDRRQAESIFI